MTLIFGIAGLLIASFAIWVKSERRQDSWFLAGSICLLIYSISIGDKIFIILQLVFIVSVLVEIFKLKKKRDGVKK